jgi:ligand-binding SRPBCC domain-containing protein
LPQLSQPSDDVTLEPFDPPPRVGAVLVMSANGLFGKRTKRVARYGEWNPPHDVVFGREARFVDVQDSGPFAEWRHSHEFESVDSKSTRVVDHIGYKPKLGLLGLLADPIFIRPRLNAMLAYRHQRLHELLDRR